jgi:4-amino-4-deoxy-L-arabinose transferase-like glycosyltransferase
MPEREWREASDMRPARVGLAVVLGCAAILRFWALGHGIPYAPGVDEPDLMGRVLTMMRTGDFNPHFFDWPGLYFYVQLPVACARFLKGAMDGRWHSLAQVDAADFLLWGRAVTALFGVATVLLVYQIGMRWGSRHALLAAGLMAVIPLHVRESHYVLTDVPMAFFVTLAFLLSIRAHEKGTAGAFGWAGAAVGLAAATKYTGATALLLPLIAAVMTFEARPSRVLCGLAAVAASGGAFLLAAPYTLVDLPGFLESYADLASHYRPRQAGAEAGWIIYVKHLRQALQIPALLLTLAGLALGVVRAARGPGRLRSTLLVVFPVFFVYFISTKALIYGRYLLPALPFVSVLAAIAVISGVSLLRRFAIPRAMRTALIAGLTVAAVVPALWQSVQFDRTISRVSTQEQAYRYLAVSVPRGSRVVVETYGLRLPDARYRVEHVTSLIEREPNAYREKGVQYVIASSQAFGPAFEAPERHPEMYAAYQRLFSEGTEMKTFAASDEHPGPTLKIYRFQK